MVDRLNLFLLRYQIARKFTEATDSGTQVLPADTPTESEVAKIPPESTTSTNKSSSWTCSCCFFVNGEELTACEICQASKPVGSEAPILTIVQRRDHTWTCETCFNVNTPDVNECVYCAILLQKKTKPLKSVESEEAPKGNTTLSETRRDSVERPGENEYRQAEWRPQREDHHHLEDRRSYSHKRRDDSFDERYSSRSRSSYIDYRSRYHDGYRDGNSSRRGDEYQHHDRYRDSGSSGRRDDSFRKTDVGRNLRHEDQHVRMEKSFGDTRYHSESLRNHPNSIDDRSFSYDSYGGSRTGALKKSTSRSSLVEDLPLIPDDESFNHRTGSSRLGGSGRNLSDSRRSFSDYPYSRESHESSSRKRTRSRSPQQDGPNTARNAKERSLEQIIEETVADLRQDLAEVFMKDIKNKVILPLVSEAITQGIERQRNLEIASLTAAKAIVLAKEPLEHEKPAEIEDDEDEMLQNMLPLQLISKQLPSFKKKEYQIKRSPVPSKHKRKKLSKKKDVERAELSSGSESDNPVLDYTLHSKVKRLKKKVKLEVNQEEEEEAVARESPVLTESRGESPKPRTKLQEPSSSKLLKASKPEAVINERDFVLSESEPEDEDLVREINTNFEWTYSLDKLEAFRRLKYVERCLLLNQEEGLLMSTDYDTSVSKVESSCPTTLGM